jgi:hypothetical protein
MQPGMLFGGSQLSGVLPVTAVAESVTDERPIEIDPY